MEESESRKMEVGRKKLENYNLGPLCVQILKIAEKNSEDLAGMTFYQGRDSYVFSSTQKGQIMLEGPNKSFKALNLQTGPWSISSDTFQGIDKIAGDLCSVEKAKRIPYIHVDSKEEKVKLPTISEMYDLDSLAKNEHKKYPAFRISDRDGNLDKREIRIDLQEILTASIDFWKRHKGSDKLIENINLEINGKPNKETEDQIKWAIAHGCDRAFFFPKLDIQASYTEDEILWSFSQELKELPNNLQYKGSGDYSNIFNNTVEEAKIFRTTPYLVCYSSGGVPSETYNLSYPAAQFRLESRGWNRMGLTLFEFITLERRETELLDSSGGDLTRAHEWAVFPNESFCLASGNKIASWFGNRVAYKNVGALNKGAIRPAQIIPWVNK